MRVEYHDEANSDILRAIAFYQSQGPGLAERLQQELDAAIKAVMEAPTRWALWRGGPLRRYVLETFQYAVCYEFESPDLIRIVILRHHSQKPGFGMRRK